MGPLEMADKSMGTPGVKFHPTYRGYNDNSLHL